MHRVVVHLRRRDLLRAQFQMLRTKRFFKLLFVVFAVFGVWDLYFSTPRPEWYFFISVPPVGAAVIVSLVLLLAYLVVAPLMLLRLRRAPGVLGEHSFEIDSECLREVTNGGETRVAFGSARRVFRTRSFQFALIRERGAFLFPRRAIADAEAYDEFWKALQALAPKKIS